jgi:hypothetical protein
MQQDQRRTVFRTLGIVQLYLTGVETVFFYHLSPKTLAPLTAAKAIPV